MIHHLTAEQMSARFSGEHNNDVERHLFICSDCETELRNFENTLLSFRTSVRQSSEEQAPKFHPEFHLQASAREIPPLKVMLCWAVAGLLLCLCLVHLGPGDRPVKPGPESQAASRDVALLRQIDQEVSRTVPGPMEPLTQLVSWNSGASTASFPESAAQ